MRIFYLAHCQLTLGRSLCLPTFWLDGQAYEDFIRLGNLRRDVSLMGLIRPFALVWLWFIVFFGPAKRIFIVSKNRAQFYQGAQYKP